MRRKSKKGKRKPRVSEYSDKIITLEKKDGSPGHFVSVESASKFEKAREDYSRPGNSITYHHLVNIDEGKVLDFSGNLYHNDQIGKYVRCPNYNRRIRG